MAAPPPTSSSLPIPPPWTELSISNSRPPARGGHACAIATSSSSSSETESNNNNNNLLFIFGGCDPFGIASDQLYQINLETGNSQICTKVGDAIPPKRSGCCLYVLPPMNNKNSEEKEEEKGKNDDTTAPGVAVSTTTTLILHGGIDYLPSCQVYGDTWIAQVDTKMATVKWQQLSVGGVSNVCRHSFASALMMTTMSDPAEKEESVSSFSAPILLFVCGGSDSQKALASPMILDVKKAMQMQMDPQLQKEEKETSSKTSELASSCSCWMPVADTNDSFTPVELCSACYLPGQKKIFIAGGRTEQGEVSDNLYCVSSSASSSLSSSFSLQKIASSPTFQRTCASLAPLNKDSSIMMIGGVSHNEQIAALPLDIAVDFTVTSDDEKEQKSHQQDVAQMKMVRPITRLEKSSGGNSKNQEIDLVGGVHFGIGQSLASAYRPSSSSSFVTVCISGLFPNQMGHTTQIFVCK